MGDKEELEENDAPGMLYFTNPGTTTESRILFPPGETLMTCPYSLHHVTTINKCVMHFSNCRTKYIKRLKDPKYCKIHVCKYDAAHHIHESEYGRHLLECPKRNLRDDVRGKPSVGIPVPELGPRRMVRTRETNEALGGLANPKINKVKLGQTVGEKGADEQDEAENEDWKMQLEQEQEEGVLTVAVLGLPPREINVIDQQGFHTPKASPPKDVMTVDKIDYYADFDATYPIVKNYKASPPLWTTSAEERFTTTEMDTSGFVTEDEANFGTRAGRKRLFSGITISGSGTSVGITSVTSSSPTSMKGESSRRRSYSGISGVGSTRIGFGITSSSALRFYATPIEEMDGEVSSGAEADSEHESFMSVVD